MLEREAADLEDGTADPVGAQAIIEDADQGAGDGAGGGGGGGW